MNQKLLAKELKKVAKMKPSLVKSKLDLSAARIAVNTEVINFTQIVKRAVIADLKSTVKRVLPTKVAKRSKSPARPSSPSRASSPRK